MRNRGLVTVIVLVTTLNWSFAEEVVTRSHSLPGASLEQELTYSTSKADFEKTRDAFLKRMRAGDPSAMQNPEGVPQVTIKTTADVGVTYRGVGLSKGKMYTCTYTASEDALWIFEGETGKGEGDRFKKCSY